MDERIIYFPKETAHILPAIGQIICYNNITTHEHFTGEVMEIVWNAKNNEYRVRLERR